MKLLLILCIFLSSASTLALTCNDTAGSVIQIRESSEQGYFDTRIILTGPVVDSLFGDATFLVNDNSSRFNFLEDASLEIKARDHHGQVTSCGRYETCIDVKPDYTGVKLYRSFGDNDNTQKGNWYFGNCQ